MQERFLSKKALNFTYVNNRKKKTILNPELAGDMLMLASKFDKFNVLSIFY